MLFKRCPTLAPRQALLPTPYALALPGFYTQPNATSPNVIGGHRSNSVTTGVVGATISGGGGANLVTDNYGTVGDGSINRAGDNVGTAADAQSATVGGGVSNTASGESATIGGGIYNRAVGLEATVGGGGYNGSVMDWATIGGG